MHFILPLFFVFGLPQVLFCSDLTMKNILLSTRCMVVPQQTARFDWLNNKKKASPGHAKRPGCIPDDDLQQRPDQTQTPHQRLFLDVATPLRPLVGMVHDQQADRGHHHRDEGGHNKREADQVNQPVVPNGALVFVPDDQVLGQRGDIAQRDAEPERARQERRPERHRDERSSEVFGGSKKPTTSTCVCCHNE